MAIEGITNENLKKKYVFFSLDDVLISGEIDKDVDCDKVNEILGNLQKLEKELDFHMFLISSVAEKPTDERIKKCGIKKYFKAENVFCVDKEYIDSKDELDKTRLEKQLKDDHEFSDEYFKQHIINNYILEKDIQKEMVVLIGHDVWTDAFYTRKFSQIDVALVKEAYSERHRESKHFVKGLIYLRREWGEFRKLLLGQFPDPDYSTLDKYVYRVFQTHLFEGKGLGSVVDKKLKDLKEK